MSLEVIDDVSTEMPASTTAPEAVEAPASVEPTQPVVDPAVTAPVTPVAPVSAVPAYTPNFKYSVRGQEKEISEKYRALIKDAESEKELKELFEKAEGLDFVKQDRASLKAEHEGFKQQITPYMQEYHKFTTLRDKGNLGAALSVAGISDDQLAEYLYNKLQAEQNPQQATLLKNQQEASLREFDMEGQLQRYQQMEQQIQAQQFEFNLSQAVAAHKDVVSTIEGKWGRPGSFMEEVKSYGIAQFHMGQNLTEAQAVDAVLNKYKPFLATTAPAAQTAQIATPHQAPAIIPSVGSSNVSPVGVRPKSVADLIKLRNEA